MASHLAYQANLLKLLCHRKWLLCHRQWWPSPLRPRVHRPAHLLMLWLLHLPRFPWFPCCLQVRLLAKFLGFYWLMDCWATRYSCMDYLRGCSFSISKNCNTQWPIYAVYNILRNFSNGPFIMTAPHYICLISMLVSQIVLFGIPFYWEILQWPLHITCFLWSVPLRKILRGSADSWKCWLSWRESLQSLRNWSCCSTNARRVSTWGQFQD